MANENKEGVASFFGGLTSMLGSWWSQPSEYVEITAEDVKKEEEKREVEKREEEKRDEEREKRLWDGLAGFVRNVVEVARAEFVEFNEQVREDSQNVMEVVQSGAVAADIREAVNQLKTAVIGDSEDGGAAGKDEEVVLPLEKVLRRCIEKHAKGEKDENDVDESVFPSFAKWKEGVDVGERAEEIGEMLKADKDLKTVFEKLVPVTVNFATFWENYLYMTERDAADTKARYSVEIPSKPESPAAMGGSSGAVPVVPVASTSEIVQSEALKKLEDSDDDELGWGSDDD